MTGLVEDGVPAGNLSGRHHFDIDVIGEFYMHICMNMFLGFYMNTHSKMLCRKVCFFKVLTILSWGDDFV